MYTYEDLLAVNESGLSEFIQAAIWAHKQSDLYKEANAAYNYFRKRNVTIGQYQKLLYTLSGEAVPDNFSANFKLTNAFFPLFVKQEVSHLLGNGVTFNEDETKEKLGGNELDNVLMKLGEYALWGGVGYGFYNLDHIEIFKVTEFVPLLGEEDGALHAGIRFWQLAETKPLRATLYEQDGYTEWIWRDGKPEVLRPKRSYQQMIRVSQADGLEILDGINYPSFPIVPMYGNNERQSELVGLREKIDAYDLIQSGFANDLDDASQIYWIIQNAGGMDDIDLAKFIERMKTVKAAVVEDDGARAEAHTLDVPYAAREVALNQLRDSLYRDAMALDTDKITAGSITATAIESSYENLSLKCDGFEMCVVDFLKGIMRIAGVEDEPTFKRSRITNMTEETQMVLLSAQYLDDETIINHLPFLNIDETEKIMERRRAEEAGRYDYGQGETDYGQEAESVGAENSENLQSGSRRIDENMG